MTHTMLELAERCAISEWLRAQRTRLWLVCESVAGAASLVGGFRPVITTERFHKPGWEASG